VERHTAAEEPRQHPGKRRREEEPPVEHARILAKESRERKNGRSSESSDGSILLGRKRPISRKKTAGRKRKKEYTSADFPSKPLLQKKVKTEKLQKEQYCNEGGLEESQG